MEGLPAGARVTTITATASLAGMPKAWMGVRGKHSSDSTVFMCELVPAVCATPDGISARLAPRPGTRGGFGNHAAMSSSGASVLKLFSNGKVVAVGVKCLNALGETLAALTRAVSLATGAEVSLGSVETSMVNVGVRFGVSLNRETLRAECEAAGIACGWNASFPGIVLRPAGAGSAMLFSSGYCTLSARTPDSVRATFEAIKAHVR